MGYVKKEVEEKELLDEIANIFVEQGWELVGDFYKVGIQQYGRSIYGSIEIMTEGMTKPIKDLTPLGGRVRVRIAKHYIVKPPNGNMHYGIAVTTEEIVVSSEDFTNENWLGEFVEKTEEYNEGDVKIEEFHYKKEGLNKFGEKVVEMHSGKLDKNRIHLYMTAKKPVTENTTMFQVRHNTQTVLDLEVQYSYGKVTRGLGFDFTGELEEADPDILQSPFSIVRTRSVDVIQDDSLSEKFPINNTNWHDDSLFEISGVVDEEFAFLVLQADSGPSFENNVTPSIPLFFGKFTALDDADDRNYALIAGSAFKTNDPRYDFDNVTPFDAGTPPMPMLKKYPNTPSNGIDNVTVFRTKGGAYYQSHHLFVEVDPNGMPPRREYDGRKYPSAWQQADAAPYNYQMNPSRYSGEVHASRIYIAHMDEGVRGYLDGVIGMNPISLLDGDTLKVKVAWCEDGFDEYEFKVLSSVSPFTKYPSTPFRPLGLGIIKKRHEEGN